MNMELVVVIKGWKCIWKITH